MVCVEKNCGARNIDVFLENSLLLLERIQQAFEFASQKVLEKGKTKNTYHKNAQSHARKHTLLERIESKWI